MTWKVPIELEEFRIDEQLGFDNKGEPFGAFLIPFRAAKGVKITLVVMASNGLAPEDPNEWEHVSVHAREDKLIGGKSKRTPTWEEMCFIKDLFWDKEDCVVQYHPPESNYVNRHKHVLHLWKPANGEFPMPPIAYV